MSCRTLSWTILVVFAAACNREPDHCTSDGAIVINGSCDCPAGTLLDKASDTCIPQDQGSLHDSVQSGQSAGDAGVPALDTQTNLDASTGSDDPRNPSPPSRPLPAGEDAGGVVGLLDSAMPVSSMKSNPTCAQNAEACDGLDNDCDGEADEGVRNGCGGCDPLANPPDSPCSAGEDYCLASGTYKCNGLDAVACNAKPKEPPTWYPDCDGDSFGAPTGGIASCTEPTPPAGCQGYTNGLSDLGDDCRDHDPEYNPGATFATNAASNADYDFNCDGRLEVGPFLGLVQSDGGVDGTIDLCPMQLVDAANFNPCQGNESSTGTCAVVSDPQTGGTPKTPLSCGPVTSLTVTVYGDLNVAGCRPIATLNNLVAPCR